MIREMFCCLPSRLHSWQAVLFWWIVIGSVTIALCVGYQLRVVLATLIFALIPSTLPTWRSTLIAAGVLYALQFVVFFWSLHQLRSETSGDGAAFFGLVFMFGIVKVILIGSCLFKVLIAFVPLWLRRTLVGANLLVAVLVYTFGMFFVARGLAVFVGTLFLWLALVTRQVPVGEGK